MEKHFKYELDNGKVVNVPLDAVDNLKKHLQISTNEAIMVWLEDNGYEVNEELENLDKQAKRIYNMLYGFVLRDVIIYDNDIKP